MIFDSHNLASRNCPAGHKLIGKEASKQRMLRLLQCKATTHHIWSRSDPWQSRPFNLTRSSSNPGIPNRFLPPRYTPPPSATTMRALLFSSHRPTQTLFWFVGTYPLSPSPPPLLWTLLLQAAADLSQSSVSHSTPLHVWRASTRLDRSNGASQAKLGGNRPTALPSRDPSGMVVVD
jgi:hypothetical protein